MKHLATLTFFALIIAISACKKEQTESLSKTTGDSSITSTDTGYTLVYKSDYTLVAPDSIEIPIDIQQTADGTVILNLRAEDLPEGVSYKLSTNYGTVPFKTTMKLYCSYAKAGTYRMKVNASNQSKNIKTFFINITIVSMPDCNYSFSRSVVNNGPGSFYIYKPGQPANTIGGAGMTVTFDNKLYFDNLTLKTAGSDQYLSKYDNNYHGVAFNTNCDNNTINIPQQQIKGAKYNTGDTAMFYIYGDGTFSSSTNKMEVNYTTVLNNDTSQFVVWGYMK